MNNDLTISSLTFKLAGSHPKDGSERRETSRGVNLPEIMRVKHSQYTDAKTKLPAVLSQLQFERHIALTDGRIAPVSATLSVRTILDVNVTSDDVLAVCQRIEDVIKNDSPGLDLPDEIFVNKEL